MELRQLEYFQMASRLNNMTRAAERLHVSQPNITVAIQKLEMELGVQLYDRTQKQLTLTPEGQIFLSRVEFILRHIQDAVIEMDDYRQLQKGGISLGIPPMIGSWLFPKIFHGFRRIYPELDLSIIEEGSLAIRRKLEANELDLGIVIISDPPASLSLQKISRSQLMACLPVNHPLSARAAIQIADLQNQPLIMMREDSFLRQIILDQCARQNFSPQIILSSNQLETIKSLVMAGIGISVLMEHVIEKEPAIVGKPFEKPLFIDVGLAWKKEKYLSRAARAFIEFIAQCRSL